MWCDRCLSSSNHSDPRNTKTQRLERLHTDDGRRESEDLGLSMKVILVPSFLHAISHCFHFPAVHGVEEELEGTVSEHDDCLSVRQPFSRQTRLARDCIFCHFAPCNSLHPSTTTRSPSPKRKQQLPSCNFKQFATYPFPSFPNRSLTRALQCACIVASYL
jgi:hypothetical protein